MKNLRSLVVGALAAALLSATAPFAQAGGPLLVFQPGTPYRWPNGGVGIPFNPDRGGLGPQNNMEAVAQTTAAFGAWALVPSATATYVNAGQLAVDVDETNFEPFLNPTAPDGLSAIVYDEDGAIFELLFGEDSGVLGFAGPEWINTVTGTITEGVSFMNGGALLGPDAFPVAEMTSVQVHEFGHYSNLSHTVVNGQIVLGDTTGPTPSNSFPPPGSLAGRIETMYPFLFINGGQATPHPDDIAMFSFLYPEPTFAPTTARISGTIRAPNGRPVTGVNVIARNLASPYEDAVSAISSDFTDDFTPGAPLVGAYTLRGLTPGASYAVFVDEILEGGFSTPPRIPLPGVEEFYNGANESANAATDDPDDFTAVSAAAGATAAGINVIFNRVPPGPLALGDDGTVELFPTNFTFKFCGQEYESFFVNANGSVTFGAGSTDLSESIQDHLGGPPRIAGLWDDLNSAAGGQIAYSESSKSVTVSWTDVPEFRNTGANTFSITLQAGEEKGHHGFHDDDDDDHGDHDDDDDGPGGLSGNRFTVRYGRLDAADGLAGYSCGGKVTSAFELETDLRRSLQQRDSEEDSRGTALFEIFTTLDNDLDGFKISYEGTRRFRDDAEPNGTRARAVRVTLPYNTAGRFSEIQPLGGDVDFYRFSATAGDVLVVETVPGNHLDTLIGLFDATGAQLAVNDDGGAFGLGGLSRLAVLVPATGTYYVGVTTWPDFAFVGAGEDFGRYVLSIQAYRGTLLPLEDDEAVSIPLAFNFPFQGAVHTSVFVNANGSLTFGAADPDFSESPAEFLAGRPRIAPLWDDLFPLDGLVIAEKTSKSLTIHFASVPEFFSLEPNYFSVKIRSDGDVEMDWHATARSDSLIGVTPGGGAADPGPRNLSRRDEWPAAGTTYEQFVGFFSNFDLSFRGIEFEHWDHDHDGHHDH